MALRKEVGGLREELDVVKSKLVETREENEKLKSLVEQEGSEKLGQNQKEDEAGAEVEDELVTENKVKRVQVNDGANQTRCQQRLQTRDQRSEKQMSKGGNEQSSKSAQPKRLTKCVTGVRKIWGTRKKESCDDIAKGMVGAVGKLPSGFSVGKRVGQVNGKSRWWFIVKAPESCLAEVDKKWNHKYWRWQLVQMRESAFLGVGPVSMRHR